MITSTGRVYSITRPASGIVGDRIEYVRDVTKHEIADDGTLHLFQNDSVLRSYPRGEWEVVGYA